MIGRFTSGFGLSLMIMLFINGALVIIKETSGPLMNWMKALTGHHWITHGMIVMVMFFILGLVLSVAQSPEKSWLDIKSLTVGIVVAAVIDFVLIAGFNMFI